MLLGHAEESWLRLGSEEHCPRLRVLRLHGNLLGGQIMGATYTHAVTGGVMGIDGVGCKPDACPYDAGAVSAALASGLPADAASKTDQAGVNAVLVALAQAQKAWGASNAHFSAPSYYVSAPRCSLGRTDGWTHGRVDGWLDVRVAAHCTT